MTTDDKLIRRVTFAGAPGSGKSTISKLLAERWQCERFYTGRAMRLLGEERGLTVLEIDKLAKTDASIDKALDDMNRALEHSEHDVVVDAHLGWHFVPSSFKVYLGVRPEVAAKRVFIDKQRADRVNEQEYESAEAAFEAQQARREVTRQRWREVYGIDADDPDNFDLVIDTSDLTVEAIVNIVERQYEAWANNKPIADLEVESA